MGHESQWRVVQRCMRLAAALIKEWVHEDDLLVLVADGEDVPREILQRRFEDDRHRLRTHLGCEILYHRGHNMYHIKHAGVFEPIIQAALYARKDDR